MTHILLSLSQKLLCQGLKTHFTTQSSKKASLIPEKSVIIVTRDIINYFLTIDISLLNQLLGLATFWPTSHLFATI